MIACEVVGSAWIGYPFAKVCRCRKTTEWAPSTEPVQRLLHGLLDVGLGQERRDIDGARAQPPVCALRQPPLLVQLQSPAPFI